MHANFDGTRVQNFFGDGGGFVGMIENAMEMGEVVRSGLESIDSPRVELVRGAPQMQWQWQILKIITIIIIVKTMKIIVIITQKKKNKKQNQKQKQNKKKTVQKQW